jgi:ribonucleoside-diphosphate reductase alpha chain
MLERPETLEGKTYRIKTGIGNLYVTVNEENGKPVEVFATIGKSGGSIAAKAEVTGRMVSLALRYGVPVQEIVDQLVDISGSEQIMCGSSLIKSIPDAVGQLLRRVYLQPNDLRIVGQVAALSPSD